MVGVMHALEILATSTSPLPGSTAQMLLVLGAVGIALFLLISIRAKIARRNAAILPPRDQIEALKAESAARQDADAIHANLQDIARKLSAQLDNKAERLEQLIQQADERLARLEASPAKNTNHAPTPAPRKVISQSPTSTTDEPPVAAQARTEPEPTDSLRRAIYALADRGRSALDIARELDEHLGKIELILALRSS